jgi:hypothetical protein
MMRVSSTSRGPRGDEPGAQVVAAELVRIEPGRE